MRTIIENNWLEDAIASHLQDLARLKYREEFSLPDSKYVETKIDIGQYGIDVRCSHNSEPSERYLPREVGHQTYWWSVKDALRAFLENDQD